MRPSLRLRLSCWTIAVLVFSNATFASKTEKSHSKAYPYLIFDAEGNPKFPKNFRSSTTAFPKDTPHTPSRAGLDTLNISGSAQFTKTNFKHIVHELNLKSGYIIDLRQESHGFLDVIPISWFGIYDAENKNKTDNEIYTLENNLIRHLNKGHDSKKLKEVFVFKRIKKDSKETFKSYPFAYYHAETEQSFIHEFGGFQYHRIYVLDHYPPTNTQIDQFVQFVKNLPESQWLHFHCHGGRGRTTTFMILYDMIRNTDKAGLVDIILRQSLIGGENFFDTTDTKNEWQVPINAIRLSQLEAFYLYVKDPNGYSKTSWTDWITKNQESLKSKSLDPAQWAGPF